MFTRSDVRTRAFTLVEILVAATLTVLLLSLLIQLIVPSLRASRKATTRMDLHQKALVLNLHLEEDFKRATRSSFDFQPDDQLLSVHRRDTTTSKILWEDSVIAYLHQGDLLQRWEIPLTAAPASPVSATFPLTDNSRLNLAIAKVSSFEVDKGLGPSVDIAIGFQDGDEQFEWKRLFFLPTSSH